MTKDNEGSLRMTRDDKDDYGRLRMTRNDEG